MISLKELQYVELWARKIPMPGVEYSINVLNNIKKCYEIYNEKYKNKEYSIIFSNSEEIEFEILSKNLCHMLGINYNNITDECLSDYRKQVFNTESTDMSSYQLLELIIENMEKVAELDNNPSNKTKAINYYKSAIKCAIFEKLSNFEKFNFAAINYQGTKENIDYNNQKILFIPSNEAVTPYFLMSIRKDKTQDADGKYFVLSLLAPANPVTFFSNQEVIIPTQILVSNNDELVKLVATPEEKIALLTMYSNIINQYNLPNKINIFGDYGSILNDMSNEKKLIKNNNKS